MQRPRAPALVLTLLEGRLVPSAAVTAAPPEPTAQAAPADLAPIPPGMVLVGTDEQGEAIYTMTVAPTQCNCAACRAGARTAQAAAAVAVAPAVAPAPATPVATAPLPPMNPPTPLPAAVSLTPAVAAVVTPPVSVAATFGGKSDLPAAPAQPLPERDAPGFTTHAQADLSTTPAPDAVTLDADALRPAAAPLIGSRPHAGLDAELTLAE